MDADSFPSDRARGLDHLPIELADGRCWDFPVPPPFTSATPERLPSSPNALNHPLGENYLPLIRMVAESESSVERTRAELALAIHLFQQRHNLPPSAVQRLFTFPPGSPELASSRSDFHELARLHLRALYPYPSPPPLPSPPLYHLSPARPSPFSLLGRLLRLRISPIPLQLLGRSRT